MAPANSGRSSSSKKKKTSTEEWPEDWPIQADDPFLELEQPALLTGTTLLSCSGSDVHWARGASSKSQSTASVQNKYLAILPGVLSLKVPDNKQQQLAAKNKKEDGTSANGTNDTLETGEEGGGETAKEEGAGGEKKKKEAAASEPSETTSESVAACTREGEQPPTPLPSSTAPTILGRLERLYNSNCTATASATTLTLNGGLKLKGRHIKTAGKFLLLQMHPRQKRVTCKHMFDSVLVFGDATIASIPPKHDSNRVMMNTDDVAVRPMEEEEESTSTTGGVDHYGASCRTVDGGGGTSNNGRTSQTTMTWQSTAAAATAALVSSKKKAPAATPFDDDDMSSSSDQEEPAMVGIAAVAAPSSTIRRPSRTAAKKPVRYSDALDELSSDDHDSDDSDNNNKNSKEDEKAEKKMKVGKESDQSNSDDDEKLPAVNRSINRGKQESTVQRNRKSSTGTLKKHEGCDSNDGEKKRAAFKDPPNSNEIIVKAPPPKRSKRSDNHDLSSSSDQEEEQPVVVAAAAAATSSTNNSRRPSRAPAKKAVRYYDALELSSDDSEEDEKPEKDANKTTEVKESDHSSSDDDNDELPAVNRSNNRGKQEVTAQRNRKSPVGMSNQDDSDDENQKSSIGPSNKKKNAPAKGSVISTPEIFEIDDSDDDGDSIQEMAPAAKKSRTAAPRAKTSAPISKKPKEPVKRSRSTSKNKPESSDEDSGKNNDDDSVASSAIGRGNESPPKELAPSKRRKSSASRVQEADDSSSSKSVEEEEPPSKRAPLRRNAATRKDPNSKGIRECEQSSARAEKKLDRYSMDSEDDLRKTENSKVAKRAVHEDDSSVDTEALLSELKSSKRSMETGKKSIEDNSSSSESSVSTGKKKEPQIAKPTPKARVTPARASFGGGKTPAPLKTNEAPGQRKVLNEESSGDDFAADGNTEKPLAAKVPSHRNRKRSADNTAESDHSDAKVYGKGTDDDTSERNAEEVALVERNTNDNGASKSSGRKQSKPMESTGTIVEVVDLTASRQTTGSTSGMMEVEVVDSTQASERILEKVTKNGIGSDDDIETNPADTGATVKTKENSSSSTPLKGAVKGGNHEISSSQGAKSKRRSTEALSVLENLEPPRSSSANNKRHRSTKEGEDTPPPTQSSAASTDKDRPTPSFRRRRTPPKPKKKLSIMDYGKDDLGFL